MIDFVPDPIAFQIGSIPIYWYGIGYALGLAAVVLVVTDQARRMGLDTRIIGNGLLVVAIAALIGGRLYHVIDQWHLYQDDPIKIILPPYSGLGAYGGLITGLIALVAVRPASPPVVLALGGRGGRGRVHHAGDRALGQLLQPGALRAADEPAVGHRDRLRPSGRRVRLSARLGPERDARPAFHPLFLYESLSGLARAR